uniref:Peptidase S33 tripeptidyl aminopeptidase-like C-terminal domain-containing protein n=1 Tax=Peronospora matthiolae TaxID=2874970 RepID=A0AAV1TLE4_9STRA
MLIYRVVALSVTYLSLPVAVVFAKKSDLNGWYPCSDTTFSDEGSLAGIIAECAVYKAPLCYPGICETLPSLDPTVDIFVKRYPATSGDPATASNVWFVQGGPGYSSSTLEWTMSYLHGALGGEANVYTMDHRGTGRSTRLDCVAAQATTTGSPQSSGIELSEVDACAQDLEYKFGDLSSFSMTSAATDIATFISKFTNGQNTTVCGVSYGTTLVERLMHLKTPTVIGYVMDGVSTNSAAPKDEFPYFSKTEVDAGEVGDAFLDFCIDDEGCSHHFKSVSLPESLQQLIKKFDKEPNSSCAQLVRTKGAQTIYPPSFSLRSTLGMMLLDSTFRMFIPPLIYRLNHCTKGDRTVLAQFFTAFKKAVTAKSEDSAYMSQLLYYLIVFSETWEVPAPTFEVVKKRLTDATMCEGSFEKSDDVGLYKSNQLYCAFSKENSPACDQLHLGNHSSSTIIYKPDKYWNKTAVIPSHTSVLLLSSKMDAQTPHKYAKAFFERLVGSNKELVTFEYATHGTFVSTLLPDTDDSSGETCGVRLLTSYVSNGGDLANLDKSCLDEVPALNMAIPADYLTEYLGTDDAYDGNTVRAKTSLST